jgi:DNA-binding transcriptional MocR family regulator
MEGTAKRVYDLAKEAGVTLTTVGATYPYGIDPKDRNLRIAPTYPADEEVKIASKILVLAIKLAAIESLLSD